MDLTLSLTHDCNLACTYCYAGPKRHTSMTMETAMRAIDFAFAIPALTRQLGFFGGEPLLEWELLRASADYAAAVAGRLGFTFKKTVTTNATLLTEDKAAWLRQNAFWLGLSIDGNRAMHDITRPLRGGGSSFDAVIRGLDVALAFFPDLEVIVVPDPSNIAHLADAVQFLAEEKRVMRIAINPNFYTDWPEQALEQWQATFQAIGKFYIARYRDNRALAINFIDGKIITRLKDGFEACDHCSFGEREIAVAPSGNIYPCERLVADDRHMEMCIGTVFDGFYEDKRRRILQKRGNVNAECSACAIRHRCMNWCCCINYAMTGAIDATDGILCFHERSAIAVADQVAETLYNESNPSFLSRFYYERQNSEPHAAAEIAIPQRTTPA